MADEKLTFEEVRTAWIRRLSTRVDKSPYLAMAWFPPLTLFLFTGLHSGFSPKVMVADGVIAFIYIVYSALTELAFVRWKHGIKSHIEASKPVAVSIAMGHLILFLNVFSLMFVWGGILLFNSTDSIADQAWVLSIGILATFFAVSFGSVMLLGSKLNRAVFSHMFPSEATRLPVQTYALRLMGVIGSTLIGLGFVVGRLLSSSNTGIIVGGTLEIGMGWLLFIISALVIYQLRIFLRG